MDVAEGQGYKYGKQEAVGKVAADLLFQMAAIAKASTPMPAGPSAPLPEPPPLQVTPKVQGSPADNDGNPLLSQEHIGKLEAAAATGDPNAVNQIEKDKTNPHWNYGQHGYALANVKSNLIKQIEEAKQTAASEYAVSIGKPKLTDIPKNGQGVPFIPENEVALLEARRGDGGQEFGRRLCQDSRAGWLGR